MNQSLSATIRIGLYDLDMAQVKNISMTITRFMATQQPFLRPGYSLKDLAKETSLPLHHLSAFINQCYGMHFNDYINRYRVRHFVGRVLHEDLMSKKLEAIAEESGFNNRNTFSLAFKKVYGQSPSDYIRTVRKMDFEMDLSN